MSTPPLSSVYRKTHPPASVASPSGGWTGLSVALLISAGEIGQPALACDAVGADAVGAYGNGDGAGPPRVSQETRTSVPTKRMTRKQAVRRRWALYGRSERVSITLANLRRRDRSRLSVCAAPLGPGSLVSPARASPLRSGDHVRRAGRPCH